MKSNSIKIAVVGTRGFPGIQGGVEAHCDHLYTHLAKKGCDITVFTRKPYVNTNIKEYNGVRLIALPALRHKSVEAFLHTLIGVFAALRYRPDILHIQAIGPALFTPLARMLGMKVVVTSHGSNYKHLKWGRFAKLVLRIGEFSGITFANKIIAISPLIAEEIREKYKRNVVFIPNGVEIPKVTMTENFIKKYGLIKRKYILAVGRFVPEKGFDVLMEAFEKLSSQQANKPASSETGKLTRQQASKSASQQAGKPTRNEAGKLASLQAYKLVIVGKADHEDKYSRGLKEKARDNKNIILTGFLTGKPLQELYSHAGLFVIPSYYEGLPIVLLEAMSYGLSCIASDIPANRNVGLDDDRFFKAEDVNGIAAKIEEFINKPFKEEERERQIYMITEQYNWGKIAEETLKVYKAVI